MFYVVKNSLTNSFESGLVAHLIAIYTSASSGFRRYVLQFQVVNSNQKFRNRSGVDTGSPLKCANCSESLSYDSDCMSNDSSFTICILPTVSVFFYQLMKR